MSEAQVSRLRPSTQASLNLTGVLPIYVFSSISRKVCLVSFEAFNVFAHRPPVTLKPE